MGDEAYKNMLRSAGLKTRSYEEVAKDWEKKSSEWYHALIADEDLPKVLAIPNLNIYAWTRCKLIANDGSEAHLHWHGLVHFFEGSKESWRVKSHRCGVKFTSKKNTFKKIKCLDHAVGVLRYLACKDGQRVGRRDGDGLCTHPHTHYSRQPIEGHHRHERGKRCGQIRDEISTEIGMNIDLANKPNWTLLQLHDHKKCLCDRGEIGLARKAEANEKRRAYYKTPAGIEMKKKYREKADVKRQILNHLSMIHVTKKAALSHETLEKLVKML